MNHVNSISATSGDEAKSLHSMSHRPQHTDSAYVHHEMSLLSALQPI